MVVMPVAEARARFSEIVETAQSTHERVEVTKNGRRAAVLLGADDYDTLLETLDILSNAELVAQIAQADREFAQGEWFDEDDVRQAMHQAGRA